MAATMGCGGQKQSRARPASRTWRACRVFSIRTGRGLAGKLLNCRSPRVCNVFRFAAQSITGSIPVGPRGRRHPLHPQRPRRQDAGRGRTAAAFGSVCRCCQPVPGARDATVASCSKSTTILPVGRVGGVLCRPSRGGKRASTRVQSTASVSCAFSMPRARSIGRPAPAGLAACGSGSDLAAGAQAGVGMLMSSPAYGSSGRGVSVESS